MTSWLTNRLKQTATLWEVSTVDGSGDITFTTPRQISCRWESIVDTFTDQNGAQRLSKAKVYVAEDLEIGDFLFLGTSAASNPLIVDDAFVIQGIDKIPDIEAKNFFRRVLL